MECYTLLATQNPSGTSAVNFTTEITSTYKSYYIVFESIISASASNSLLLTQISTDGGSSYITNGYKSQSSSESGLRLSFMANSSVRVSGTHSLFNLTSGSGYINSCGTDVEFIPNTSAYIGTFSNGYSTASQTVNALRVVMSNGGNFSGSISLYGLNQ